MQRFGRFNRPGLKGSANYSLLGGASGCSDPAPVDPTSVAATPDSPAIGVAVSWTASSTAQYNVYRNTTNSTTGATLVGSSSGSGGMSYVDNSANSGSNRPLASTTYFYWVQGVTCGGTSALIPASQNSTGGVTTAAITYTTYLPNNANLTVSDYVNIAEQSTTRLRFSRPAGSFTQFQNNFPGSRVSFVTNATYLRVIMNYNDNPGASYVGMVGAVLVNNVEHSTFTYTGAVPGSGTHDITLPGGSNTVSILWQTGAYVDLTSVALDSGASIGTATRPANSIVLAGDSITQGFSATKPTVAWANQVATAQGRKSFNVGYGNASTQWLDAVTMLASVPTSDLGTLMVGVNDAASQLPLAVYGSNVRGWLLKAKPLMSDPRLFMCSPIFYNTVTTPITMAQYRTEAKNTVEAMMTYGNGDSKLFYLDGLALMPSNNSGLADGVHPNNTGSNEIATNINAAMNATPPAAPSGLAATVISSSQVDLSWTDNASTETGFIVQRRFPASAMGVWEQVGVTLSGTTTFSDTGLASSSQYEYRVCAYNGGGSSAFTSSVTPTTSAGTANRIRVLVIGGGGGGGDAGGGGGGGARHDTAFVATPGTTYNIVIGAGGAAGGVGARGGSGVASSFDTISAAGGGGGGAFSATLQNGIDGGCGGGAGTDSGGGYPSGTAGAGNTPNTSPSQGNNGGTAQGGTRFGFGGGGGAGSVGRNGSNAIVSGSQGGYGGEGGDGASNNIRGLYEQFAGGGGGGGWQVGGVGGRGGGGDGQCYSIVARNPTAGTVNSGGGGGGGFASAGGGSAGGSGIVVLRMPTSAYTGVTTGSPAVTTSGNDTVLTFSSSGSYKA